MNSSMRGGFNGNDITPSSPGFDVCMGSVVPALVRRAVVFLSCRSRAFIFHSV